MILEGVFLQWGSIGDAYWPIGDVLQSWMSLEIFTFILPFLLIFALIYGILVKSNIFGENKGVYTIIALAIAALAVWIPGSPVPFFFAQLFPRLGMGVAVLVAIMILMGLFVDWENKNWKAGFAILGGVIALFVLFNAFSAQSLWSGGWWYDYGGAIVVAIIIIAVIAVIVATSKSK